MDIWAKTANFVRQSNSVLFQFSFLDPPLKPLMFQLYCLSLYGGCIWNLDSRKIQSLEFSFNNLLRHVWSLPYNCHTRILHSVAVVVCIILYTTDSLTSFVLSRSSSFIRCLYWFFLLLYKFIWLQPYLWSRFCKALCLFACPRIAGICGLKKPFVSEENV